ncbi:hypothetical protein FSARC_10314 [Fusarium sarcochroum]|uniref:Ankyrin n=1 Tax=Fusarium sarcochroum TaxID=1208366 RepID=A0A8H4TN94_9HYPO|nr:hypothetical protein FSARC_10314 [Fusarium sarcochroum]
MPPPMQYAWIVYAMFIASVRADSLDDFTNNLFTDLAPILALFGERVTMQFLSQALGWADCVALAMAPLGIITILVSAIRVGGPKWLQAVIGRVKENTAAAEMELMSSTSPEVCELFNGDSIVRCQGTSPVWEFICIFPKGYNHDKPDMKLPLRFMPLEKAIEEKLLKVDPQSSTFIPTFIRQLLQPKDQPDDCNNNAQDQPPETTSAAAALSTGVLSSIFKFFVSMNRRSARPDIELAPDQPSSHQPQRSDETQSVPFIAIIRDTGPNWPNISLNLQNSHRRAGIRFIALLGTLLQGGVLVFFGVMSYYPRARPSFQKDDQPVARYAFALATSGTVLLVLGMFICGLVVENSTDETRYRTDDGSKFVMCWVQQGQTVSDQVFDSYVMSQSFHGPVITKSARAKDVKKNHHQEGQSNALEAATITGVVIGLAGFIIQFIGLRAMNSAASLAQLAAVGIMTLSRALVRPGFASSFGKIKLLPDFELNWLAWELVTKRSVLGAPRAEDERKPSSQPKSGDAGNSTETGASSDQPSSAEGEESTKKDMQSWSVVTAQELMLARREICKLGNFQGETSEIAVNLALSIEDALNMLLPDGVSEIGAVLSWLIDVNYSLSVSKKMEKQEISIDLSYRDGTWRVPADSLDAVLSLWTYTIRAQEKREQELEDYDSSLLAQKGDGWLRRRVPAPSLRLFGPQKTTMKSQQLYELDLWVPQCLETLMEVEELDSGKALASTKSFDQSRVVGCGRSACHGNDNSRRFETYLILETMNGGKNKRRNKRKNKQKGQTVLGIETHDSLEYLCAKDLFFSFMCSAAKTPGACIRGEAELRRPPAGDGDSQRSQFLWNKDLSVLAESCYHRGFGTYQEALMSIISPLSMAQILPFPHAWFQAVCAKMSEAGKNQDELTLVSIYRDLVARTRCYTPDESGVRECCLALLLEVVYDFKSEPSPMATLGGIPSQLRLLFEELEVESNFLEHLQKLSRWSHRPINLGYVKTNDNVVAHDEESNNERLGEKKLDEVRPRLEDFPTYFMLTESHLDAAYNAERNAAWGKPKYKKQDAHTRDICGRIPLHYLAANCMKEYEIIDYVEQHRELINIQDHHGYTPLHYACGFGSPQGVGIFLELGAKINVQGLDGMYPMHLAAHEGNEGAMFVILEWTDHSGNASYKPIRRLPNYDYNLPIHCAVMAGHKRVIERLKADIDMEGESGHTPLELAARHGGEGVLEKVVELSADLDRQDKLGFTVLNGCCSWQFWEKARVLMHAGADPNVRNREGRNALDNAFRRSVPPADVVLTMLEKGARMQLPAEGVEKRKSPMHMAASNGDGVVIGALLDSLSVADALRVLDLCDSDGQTPLQIARLNNHEEAVRVLQKARTDRSASS